ncbi:hypothetical protein [Thalassobacillus sp. C254]|nr:hypothetical protein [Thalassobacillus sp. C254]
MKAFLSTDDEKRLFSDETASRVEPRVETKPVPMPNDGMGTGFL